MSGLQPGLAVHGYEVVTILFPSAALGWEPQQRNLGQGTTSVVTLVTKSLFYLISDWSLVGISGLP
jgi:hypothetical protein